MARADRRAGEIVATLYNIHTRESENDRTLGWRDVFSEWREPTKEQTEDEMLEAMMLWTKRTEGLPH